MKKKLRELKEKYEEKQITQSKTNNETVSTNQNENQKEELWEIESKTFSNSWQFNSIWNQLNNSGISITQEELRELENYSESLKQFQKNNSTYLQKWKLDTNKDIFERAIDNNYQDSFLKEILSENESLKDW